MGFVALSGRLGAAATGVGRGAGAGAGAGSGSGGGGGLSSIGHKWRTDAAKVRKVMILQLEVHGPAKMVMVRTNGDEV